MPYLTLIVVLTQALFKWNHIPPWCCSHLDFEPVGFVPGSGQESEPGTPVANEAKNTSYYINDRQARSATLRRFHPLHHAFLVRAGLPTMESRRDGIYGECITDYPKTFLSHFPHNDPWSRADTQRLQEFMERVSNEELTPIQILQRRLRCTQVAQWVCHRGIPSGGNHPLRFYLDSLRQYLDKHKLFDYYHGFLCTHILARIFQICILSNLNVLGPETFSDLEPDKDDASDSLVELTSEHINNNLHPTLYKKALGYRKSTTGQATIFHNGGGFTLEEAELMLDWMWKDRKAFMVLCAKIKMRGWSALFFGLWGLLRESVRAYENCKRIRHLLMRYALCASSDERMVITEMIMAMEQQFRVVGAECQFEVPPLDREDGQNILDTFKDYLVPTESVVFPFELVYNTSLHTRPEEVSSLLVTIMDHTWKTLEYERPDWKQKYSDAFYYGARVITSLNDAITHFSYGCIKNKHASIDAYFGVINRIDFLELIGRLCLIMVVQSRDDFIIPKYYAETFYYNINSLMASFSKAADNNEYTEAPGLQETWDKLLQFINLQYETIEGGPVRNRISLCRNTWLVIGKAFEFQQQTSLRRRCMNPRCPDPDLTGGAQKVCDKCPWVAYCSDQCQAIHWDGGLPDSHRTQCIALESQ